MTGIFDSGVGGLSVFREIYRRLPGESYIYYSDNAHCPYGEKSQEYVTDRARQITGFLIRNGAEIIVVACNTATAAAISTLRKEYSDKTSPEVRERVSMLSGGRQDHIMFIGMEPAVKPAALNTRSGVIGVLATAGTLKGSKYITNRDLYSNEVKVVEHVGQGFVELVENGNTEGPEAERTVAASVKPLIDAGADTIVLGCTHYPFLRETIAKVAREMAPDRVVTIIDPAPAVARHLEEVMQSEGLLHDKARQIMQTDNGHGNPANIRLVASGDPSTLHRLSGTLLQQHP
ncbi:MAG: glutamate racemase [Clostridium sp.]|nr:glutamate racemase [Bacteroides sp.]MCM1197808.1 glutamate racemase [Clostridium sp.]